MSRRHRKLEPISLEAIETNPCITGLESVLRFNPPKTFELFPKRDVDGHPIPASPPSSDAHELDQPALCAPGLNAAVLGAPELGAPALNAPALLPPGLDSIDTIAVINQETSTTGAADCPGASNKGAVNQGTPLLTAPLLRAPLLDLPVLSTPELGAPGLDAPALEADFVYRPPVKITPATSVQDGHTHGEQRVFDTLSRLAQPYQDARRIAIGIRSLARAVPMTYNNCLENVRSLIAKLAIEVVPSSKISAGQTYIIYGCTEILRRRRAAGLTHVIRRTKGVQLINPDAPALGAPVLNQGAPY